MDSAGRDLPERSLGDILNETFVIYGRYLGKFLGIAAIVQVPAIATLLVPVENLAIYVILNLISLSALVSVFGATIYAVGQQYVTGSVTVADCYRRVLWRVLTLGVLAAIFAAITVVGILLMIATPYSLAVALALMLGAYVVPAMAGPVVIVEGGRSVHAFNRSWELAQRSMMRIAGHLVVYFLVALGMGLVLFLPFLFIWPGDVDALSRSMLAASSLLPAIAVPPVVSIAVTLLYYDLRVRRERYDIERLSQELGLVPA